MNDTLKAAKKIQREVIAARAKADYKLSLLNYRGDQDRFSTTEALAAYHLKQYLKLVGVRS